MRIVDPLALPPETAAAWDALALQASEPNAFAERWCLAPALQLLDGTRSARLLLVEVGAELIGIASLARAQHYGPMPLRHWVNWTHPNHFHGAPLVREGFEAAFWSALLGWCDAQPRSGPLLQWRGLTADGRLYRALAGIAALRGHGAPAIHHETRALLETDLAPEAYWETVMRGKKRKELRRQAGRLAEMGALDQRRWQQGEAVEPWADAFLALEFKGWKGRAGSALACDTKTAAWLRTIVTGAAAAGRLDMRMLAQNGQPLAMLLNFLCPPGGFSFKTAYDEDFSRFSPGVLLQQANLDLLNRGDIAWVDSCAAEGHPMIDSIWRDRRTLLWANVPLGGWSRQVGFALLMRAERLWRTLRWESVATPRRVEPAQ